MSHAQLVTQFFQRYGESPVPVRKFFAPGRVNLIGDHIDYNGGQVFPCAIDRGTTLLIRRSANRTVKLASLNFDLMAVLSDAETGTKYGDHWINYPLGVIQQFRQAGYDVSGFECLYSGNLPSAAGLSSSAAIEVVTAKALNEVFNAGLSDIEIVKLCQRAENDFVGVQCGIMDQFAVTMGKSDHAMLLDCQTLDCQQVPLELGDHRLLLINTNQRRELAESHYNERVRETKRALDILKQATQINALTGISPAQLEQHAHLFDNASIEYRRARHVASEQQRVEQAVAALQEDDLQTFGKLMFASHQSLRDDYGVSSDPLNLLVEHAQQHDGVLGARLTGAGFGGCTVNLIHQDAVQSFTAETSERYQQQTGLTATWLQIEPSQGVRELSVDEP